MEIYRIEKGTAKEWLYKAYDYIRTDAFVYGQNIPIEVEFGHDEPKEELEAIVYSGTKININYFLEEIMDPDKVDEIFDYFNNAETDKLNVALDELGEDDFTEAEIRLVRIKFLSEVGN